MKFNSVPPTPSSQPEAHNLLFHFFVRCNKTDYNDTSAHWFNFQPLRAARQCKGKSRRIFHFPQARLSLLTCTYTYTYKIRNSQYFAYQKGILSLKNAIRSFASGTCCVPCSANDAQLQTYPSPSRFLHQFRI